MEFLIIVFIIISIISSVSKNIKKHMKKEASFDPWSFDSDSMGDNDKNVKETIKAERNYVEKERPKVDPITEIKKDDLQKDYSETQTAKVDDFQSYNETREEIKTPTFQDGKKENINRKDTGELGRDLGVLLTGNKLPLGIVISEVLGPPKALKPYSHKRN